MKPQTTYRIVFFAFAAILIILLLCVFYPSVVKAQQPGVGIGKTSDGRTSVKALVTDMCHGFGLYATHYAQAHCYQLNATYTENRATIAGITYRIHQKVTVYAGAGCYNHCTSVHGADKQYLKAKGACAETGAIMQLLTIRRFNILLDASLNTTQQLNTMFLFTINL